MACSALICHSSVSFSAFSAFARAAPTCCPTHALAEDAPTLARALSDNTTTDWSALAPTFTRAWAWRWTKQSIEAAQQPDQNDNLDAELDALDDEISSLTAQLAAEQAWQECLQRMTSREVTALRLEVRGGEVGGRWRHGDRGAPVVLQDGWRADAPETRSTCVLLAGGGMT